MGWAGTAWRRSVGRLRNGPSESLARPALAFVASASAALLVQACTVQSMALRSVDVLFDKTVAALMAESDLSFAESAIAGDMKLLEGVVESDPTNVRYLQLACMGYTSFALAFAEDEPSRALLFYSRARDYGIRGLLERGIPKSVFSSDAAAMSAAVHRLARGDVPLAFWTASAWGSAIRLQPDDPDAVAAIPSANALMQWVMKQDPDFFYGGPYLYFGVYYGSYPPALGGRPDLSRENFDNAHASGNGRFLMTDVLYASTYAVLTQDRNLFHRLLTRVSEAPADILPEQRLANAVAHKRARQLLAREEELF